MIDSQFLRFSPDVESALQANRPIVALESTVIAHGLPRPQNFETARELETIVKQSGAVPATIAILNGQFCVGLNQEELEQIASADDIQKISIRDLPVAFAKRSNGATTVASTIWIAHRAGLKVFSTGGIGGVHRGDLLDVSADLPQLATTSMIVVCSGAKIVLDLPATREWLETHGITVVGYECNEMPAFYSRQSGLPVDVAANSIQDIVNIYQSQRQIEINSALLVTVPVPASAEIPAAALQNILDRAMAESERAAVKGRYLTPFLLSRMAQQSGGATLTANIALLKNNARVAAEIAVLLQSNSAWRSP